VGHGASANDPAHRRIAAEPVGVVDVFISGQPTKHRLAKLRDQGMTTVAPGATIRKHMPGEFAQAERIVEFTKGQQACFRRDPRSVKFQLQPGVEIDPQIGPTCFTRRPSHAQPLRTPLSY
jgi:hypothetical protein